MTDDDTGKKGMDFAALQTQIAEQAAEITTLRGETGSLTAERKREKDVDAAVIRLQDRPNLQQGLRDDLMKFHEDHPDAFEAYVEQLAKRNPVPKDSVPGGDGTPAGASDLAMLFADHGGEAVTQAGAFEAEHATLVAAGQRMTTTPREYVELRMEMDAGITLAPTK